MENEHGVCLGKAWLPVLPEPREGVADGKRREFGAITELSCLGPGFHAWTAGQNQCRGEDCRSGGPVCFQQGLGPFIHDDSSCQGVICVEMSRT